MDDQPSEHQKIAELEARLQATEASLAAVEAKVSVYETLLEQMPVEVALKDAAGRYEYLNGQSRRLYGFSEVDYKGKLPTDVFRSSEAKALHEHDLEVLRSGRVSSQVVRVPEDGDEQVFLAMKFPIHDALANTHKLGAVAIDITEDVKQIVLAQLTSDAFDAELGSDFVVNALRESEARYRAVIEDQTEHICRLSPEGIVTFVNQVYCDYIGQPQEHIVGRYRPFHAITHPDDIALVNDQQSALSVDRPSATYDHRVQKPGGEIEWLRWTDHALFDAAGTLVEIQRVGRNVTAQIRAEQALRESERMRLAEARMAALGQLIATVAHELRHPLGTISSSVATLSRRLELTEERDLRVMERIERNVGRTLRIIDELLTYSREGYVSARLVQVDDWIAQVTWDMEATDDVSIDLELDCPREATFDPDRMHQVLRNLIENSAQALREHLPEGERPHVLVRTGLDAGYVQIQVVDEGPGIESEVLADVFEPLFTTKPFGVGLGLPLVKKVMLEHAGEVAIDAPLGVGTTVTLSFPAAADAVGEDNRS